MSGAGLPFTVRSAATTVVEIPFDGGGKGEGITPTAWRSLEIVLVRVEDEDGFVGWGEGFGYFTADATKALIDRLILPVLVGATVDDVGAWNLATQRRLHLFGRYGVTMFALSGVDMALWDLAAKRAGVPLHVLLEGASGAGAATTTAGAATSGAPAVPAAPGPTAEGASGAGAPVTAAAPAVPFYASLVRYADAELVAAMARRAVAGGFRALKLHEIALPEIAAARAAVGSDVPIAVDVNCNWTARQAAELAPALADLGVRWLEEPLFPPEDFAALRSLRALQDGSGRGVPIAAGENWCTAEQFSAALAAGAVDLAQPSVTKVGGVTEFLRVAEVAARHGVPLMPHCPYFGPGFFASLHLAAALPSVAELEYHFVDVEAWLAHPGAPDASGALPVPGGPGLGFEPDEDVLARYARGPR